MYFSCAKTGAGGLVGTKLERKMEKKHSSSAQFSALGWFFLLVYQTTK